MLPPFTLFTALYDSAAAKTKACLLDEWSARLLDVYPDLSGDECSAVLAAHASIGSTKHCPCGI
eukprot:5535090-Amphidinium_carterae.3